MQKFEWKKKNLAAKVFMICVAGMIVIAAVVWLRTLFP